MLSPLTRSASLARAIVVLSIPGVTACLGAPRATPRPGTTRLFVTEPAITAGDLRQRLFAVAHDSMQGRFTGSDGHYMVTAYIAREAERLGLRPAGERGSYFQTIPYVRHRVARASMAVAGQPLVLGEDVVPQHPRGKPHSIDGARVIFGGNIQDTASLIAPEQAVGRIVVLVQNANNRAGNINPTAGQRYTAAAAVAMVNAPDRLAVWKGLFITAVQPEYVGEEEPQVERPLQLAISPRAAERLLGRPVDATVTPGTAGVVVTGEIAWQTDTVPVRNVIAVLPGGDAARAGEYVALGAHSDHVAPAREAVDHDSVRLFNTLVRTMELSQDSVLTNAQRRGVRVNADSLRAVRALREPRRDSIHNGADDDGSGTVALLEVAEALSAGPKPARSVLFVWHAAEEGGLRGSRFFTERPTIPLDAIIAQVNMDMVGRGGATDVRNGGPGYLELIGPRRRSPELGRLIDVVNGRQATPFTLNEAFDAPGHPEQRFCRSDHYNYARQGIPIAYFSTGHHQDYHQVTDEPQYIDYPKMARVAQLVADVAMAASRVERRFAVEGLAPDANAPCRQ